MWAALKSWAIFALHTCIWVFANVLAFFGLFLILYQVWLNIGGHIFFTDHFLNAAGLYLPSISLFLVVISIYFEKEKRTPPTRASKMVSAPIFIAISVIFFLIACIYGEVSSRFTDALSMVAIGGALQRLTGMPFDTNDVTA